MNNYQRYADWASADRTQRDLEQGDYMNESSEPTIPTLSYDSRHIAMDRIEPRPHNRKIDPASVSELADSILKNGLQTPITVRHRGLKSDRLFQIVAGERRWLAHKKLGLETISAFVREMSDEEAAEFAIIENLQRENLHPLEEAQAYEIILKHQDYTLDRLSKRVSKEVTYLRRVLEFLKLIAPLRKLFVDGRIGVEQAKQLCRIPAEAQKTYLKWVGPLDDGRGLPSATKIEEWIEHNVMLDLGTAPFDIAAEKLVPKAGACPACPKRTGFDKALFDDVKKGDFCLDSACFNSKVERLIQIAVKAEPELIQVSRSYKNDPDRPKDALPVDGYTEIKNQADECKSPSQAIVVHGIDRGSRIVICRDQSCKEHVGRYRGEHASGEAPEERAKRLKAERTEKQKKETRRTILKAIGEKVEELKQPDLQALAIAMFMRLWGQMQHKVIRILEWAPDKAKKRDIGDVFAEEIATVKAQRLNQILVILALASHMDGPAYDDKEDVLLEFAKRYRVNVDKIKEEIGEKYKAKPKK